MDEIRGMRLDVRTLKGLIGAAPFLLAFGSAGSAKLIALPAMQWVEQIAAAYGGHGRRLDVDHRGLKESVVICILTDQVDANLEPWTYGFLEVKGTPGFYLVPASPYWLGVVGEGQ